MEEIGEAHSRSRLVVVGASFTQIAGAYGVEFGEVRLEKCFIGGFK